MTDKDKIEESQDSIKTAISSSSSEQQQTQQDQMTFQYDRDEMLALRDVKLSRIRPPELSREFDSDKGLFSPDKWVQYKWQCEGVEPPRSRRRQQNVLTVTGANALPIGSKALSSILETTIASTNKNDDLLDDQHTLLSPQRRGFSSGCKAASPPPKFDKSHHHTHHQQQQQSSSSNRSRWQIKSNGIDFKPAFQKNALEANSRSSRSGSSQNTINCSNNNGWNSTSWNASGHLKHGGDKNRRFADRERTRSSNTESDLPEWAEAGPTSVHDMIELKGFDDDYEDEQTDTEEKRRHSKGRKDSNGNNHLKASSETSTGPTPRSVSRQKRHSSGDVAPNNNNNSRPPSRKTPQKADSNCSIHSSSGSPVRVIQASELESSILREYQEKLKKEQQSSSITADDGSKPFDIFAALGIKQPTTKDSSNNYENDKTSSDNKLPNSDAEFAACILGLPLDQIAKLNISNINQSVNNDIQQQHDQPTTSRLIRWQQKATTTAITTSETLSEQQQQQQRHSISPFSLIGNSGHHQHLPPSFTPQLPQFGGSGSFAGGGMNGNFSTYFQHLLMETARSLSPNPHFPPDQATLRLAFWKLWNDPEIRPLIINNTGNGFNNSSMAATIRAGSPLPPPHFQPSQQQYFSGGGAPSPFGGINNPFGISGGIGGGPGQFQQFGPGPNNFGIPPYVAAAPPFTPQQFFPPGHHHPNSFNYQQQFIPPGHSNNSFNYQQQQQNTRQQSPYNSMIFPPPLVSQQQQKSAALTTQQQHHQNLLNSPAFMPTSVMRQLSKIPGGGSSVNSGGNVSTCGNNNNRGASPATTTTGAAELLNSIGGGDYGSGGIYNNINLNNNFNYYFK